MNRAIQLNKGYEAAYADGFNDGCVAGEAEVLSVDAHKYCVATPLSTRLWQGFAALVLGILTGLIF